MSGKSFQVSIDFIGNISDLQSKIKQVTGEISKISATTGGAQVQKQFEQLVKTVTDLQTRASQPIGSKAEFNKLAGEVSKANMTYGQLLGTIERLQSLGGSKLLEFLPKDQQNNIKQATQAVKEFEEAKKAAQKAMSRKSKDQTDYSNLQSSAQSAAQKVEELEAKWKKANSAKNRYFKKENVTGKEKELASLKTREEGLVTQSKRKAGLSEAQASELDQVRNRISEIKAELASIKADPLVKSAEEATTALNKAKDASNKLNNDVKNFKISDDGVKQYEQAFEQLKQKAAQLGVQVNDIGSVDNVQTLLNRLNQLESDGFIEGAQAAQQYANTIRSILDPAFKQMETGMNGVNQSWGQFMSAQEDMSMLQNRLKYFFSLANSIQLLKRTITSAMNTVKELDAVMTETAVVTDFTVGDMWEKLPEYADQASALGASIKDLYAATTLYYQQGLNSEQAMSVGIETMKMARIANMDAAEATKAMTAALRGFNMEINETSATRINDVYSELAAITAADTEQIATAMGKTASIANSANMEFETTAALLAQIIETTQEAPETAGTAMKTIIARFTEVKQLFDEGMLSGEDSEGEAIEINKIDAALRKVGISLADFLKGKKGIDDIFLELASKWDTLDLATQRYIATTAAGSRQQSRFIAMMSNYDRTMELVTAANNSAGASQEQFDKTLDSMEAKLQKLKDAWDEFTMGIANNQILKGGINLLTGLLETINKLTDALSGGDGLSKSFLNLMTVIGALSGGKKLLAKGFGTIGTWMGVNQNVGQQQQKELNAFQRANQYSKQGQTAKQKIGYYAAGLFAEKQDRKFQKTLDEKQQKLNKISSIKKRPYYDMIPKKLTTYYDNLEAKAKQPIDELKSIQDEFKKTGQISEQSAKTLKQYGLTTQDVANSVYPLQINLRAVGAAATLAGGAFGLLAKVLEENGMEDAAEGFRTLSTVMTGSGSVLMMLSMVMGDIKIKAGAAGIALVKTGADGAIAGAVASAGWAPFLITIGLVTVAVIGLIWAFKAIHAASPEGKLEAATQAANDAAEAAENAAQAYEHLAAALDSIGGKSSALENLAVGTTEWKNAVQELNGEVLDLVEQYPELAKFVDNSKGYLTLDRNKIVNEKTVDDVLETYQNNKFRAQSASAAAKLQKQQAQLDVDFQNLSYDAKAKQQGLYKQPMTTEEARGMRNFDPNNVPDKEKTDQLARELAQGKISLNDERLEYLKEEGKALTESEAYIEFRKYGEGLIAADAATKVFTDSLMSNAMMVSDISEHQKSNMMNFLDSEQVKNQVDKMLETINQNWTNPEAREQYKKDYAKIMGYEYDEDKKRFLKDGQEVQVSDESIRKQMAGVEVQNNLTERMKALNTALTSFEQTTKSANKTQENYYKHEDGLKDAFIQLTSDAEGAGLTFKAIDQLGEEIKFEDGTYTEDENKYFTKLFEENEKLQEAYGGDIQEFLSFIYKNLNLAKERKQKTTEKATQMRASKDESLAIETADLSSGIISNIIDGLYDVALASGNEKARELDSYLSNIMKDMEPEAAQKFAQAIGDLNWRDINDVENLSNDLEDLGIASLFSEGQIDELEQKIISLAKAARAFNSEELKKAFGKSRNLAEEVRGREDGERTFTEDQMKQLIESGGAKAEDFVWTGEDEFAYIGASMDTLASALDANTAALLGETIDTVNEEAWIAKKWQEAAQEGTFSDAIKSIGEAKAEDITYENGAVKIGEATYDQSSLRNIAQAYGIGGEAGIPENLGVEQLITLITEAYAKYASEAARLGIINNADTVNAMAGASQAYLLDSGIITGQASSGKISSENAVSALSAQGFALGVDPAEIQVLTQEIIAMDAAYEKVTLTEERVNIVAQSHANQLAKLRKEYEKSSEALKEYFEEYKGAEKNPDKARVALAKIRKEIKKSFNLELTDEQIVDNMHLFEDWANGVEDAGKKIAETFQDEFAEQIKQTGVDIQGAYSDVLAAMLALPDGVHITGDFDNGNILSSITGTESEMLAFKEFAEGLNMTVTWVETDGGVELPDGTVLPEYRLETISSGKGGPSGGGGGGGGGGGSEWENPYDKLYNVQENIDRTIREREQIERRYQRLLDRRLATAQELYKTSQAEIDALREQAEYQQKMVAGRQEMLQEQMDENKDLQKYATVNVETGQITIDWDLINSVTDEEEGKKIEEYISKLEELRDSMHEAQDAIEEIDDSIWEIEERGREEYMEFEDRVKEALVEVFQKEIDSLEEINNSINETNEKLIDSIQNSIDKIRQDRENEKTEEELGEKQRRLAYLEQDTSGANALEILELQEEIRQGQEDYTDSLIDQKISELQEQNDKAAEQREQQITLMQNQLDWSVESGRIWAEVETLMKEGLNPQGGLIRGSMLEQILQKGESWKALSEIGQMDWLLDLETMVAQSSEWRMKGGQLENLENKLTGQEITFRNAKGEVISGKVDEKGQVVLDNGSYYKDVYQWIDGTYHTTENEAIKPILPSSKPISQANQNTSGGQGGYNGKDSDYNYSFPYKDYYYDSAINDISHRIASVTRSGKTIEDAKFQAELDAEKLEHDSWSKAVSQKKRATQDRENGRLLELAALEQARKAAQEKAALEQAEKLKKLNPNVRYATGGLADFTGPAWLDGTKSRPELVLNQRDTQNFIQLKDILSSIMSRNIPTTHTSTENNGDLSFDIDINVESLQSDYDVEQVASKVKSMIVDNARYRNNNTISLTR